MDVEVALLAMEAEFSAKLETHVADVTLPLVSSVPPRPEPVRMRGA